MSTARTPALNHAMNTVRPAYIGAWFSLEECEPKRPPRLQKFPLASDTLKVDTPTGCFSSVTSTMNAICRGSRHSLTSDSFTTTTKSRLLPGQPEIADEERARRVRQVEHLRHAPGAPLGQSGDEVGDAAVAFPPALVRAFQLVDHDDDARGLLGRRDVPDLVREVAEGAQQVELRLVGFRQVLAAAHAHHLRAAGLGLARLARNVGEVARLARVGDIDDPGPAVLFAPGERIHGAPAVMTDVGDPAPVLLVDHRLGGAAALQVG